MTSIFHANHKSPLEKHPSIPSYCSFGSLVGCVITLCRFCATPKWHESFSAIDIVAIASIKRRYTTRGCHRTTANSPIRSLQYVVRNYIILIPYHHHSSQPACVCVCVRHVLMITSIPPMDVVLPRSEQSLSKEEALNFSMASGSQWNWWIGIYCLPSTVKVYIEISREV